MNKFDGENNKLEENRKKSFKIISQQKERHGMCNFDAIDNKPKITGNYCF
jgi:hypothetical protein